MSSDSKKPLVLVYGATGSFGISIIDGLLRSGLFRVAATTRTLDNPKAVELKSQGVDVRAIDVAKASHEELKSLLAGVDIIVSSINAWVLDTQIALFRAAKDVGVKRVVPSDFGTPAPPGAHSLHDAKSKIQAEIKQIGIGYTFIDIGWWSHLPFPKHPAKAPELAVLEKRYGTGNPVFSITALENVGDWVARILHDERTLNQYVFVWEHQTTNEEIADIVRREVPDGENIVKNQPKVSDEEVVAMQEAAAEALKRDPSDGNLGKRWLMDYIRTNFVQGYNTLETAKSLGALDARELYPEVKVSSLEEYAKKSYK